MTTTERHEAKAMICGFTATALGAIPLRVGLDGFYRSQNSRKHRLFAVARAHVLQPIPLTPSHMLFAGVLTLDYSGKVRVFGTAMPRERACIEVTCAMAA